MGGVAEMSGVRKKNAGNVLVVKVEEDDLTTRMSFH